MGTHANAKIVQWKSLKAIECFVKDDLSHAQTRAITHLPMVSLSAFRHIRKAFAIITAAGLNKMH